MNLTEVSSGHHLSSPKSQLIKVEAFVLVSFFLLLVQLPCRFFRRRLYKSWKLKALDSSANAAMFLLIPFIFGMMLSLDFKHKLVPFWATFLVLLFSSVPDAFYISSELSLGLAYAKFLLYWAYVYILFHRVQSSSLYLFDIPLGLFLIASFCILLEKVSIPLTFSSLADTRLSPHFFRYLPKFLLDRPNNDINVDQYSNMSPSEDDPFLQCKYVLDPTLVKFDKGKIVDEGITISKIWSCEDGALLTPTRAQLNNGLKNTCLSFSLFWSLLNKCRGVPSYEGSEPEEAWKFIQHGLLMHESPLKLIEVELSFLGDFFLARYCAFAYHLGYLYLFIRQLLFLGGMSWVVIQILKNYHPGDQTVKIQYHGHDMDVLVTVIGIISLTLLQLTRLVGFCTSSWAKMRLMRVYLIRESWKKKNIWDQCIKKAAQILCPVRYHPNKALERKLGQYSLLRSCARNQTSSHLILNLTLYGYTGIKYGTPGRQESNPKTMSNEIEDIVIQSLRDHGPQLTNGIGSVEASNLPEETQMKLTRACRHSTKLDTQAQVVLAWHIATSVCDISPTLPLSARQCSDFRVATTLSEYCAYLVAFAPDLLPGHAITTNYACTYTINEAYTHLCRRGSSSIYDKLMEIANDETDDPEEAQKNMGSILQQGAALGKVLEMEITDAGKRWKVLADFWAEMILYLAPNTNNDLGHIARLADGGEFITLLWALLFHAGIVNRDSLEKRVSNASAETSSAS